MTEIQKSEQELNSQFDEILVAIHNAKSKAYQNLNKELINLYWQIGQYIGSNYISGSDRTSNFHRVALL